MKTLWSPNSWRGLPIRQQPPYGDQAELATTVQKLKALPPLVSADEIDQLSHHLAAAARGEVFLIQGGDCAELFADCREDAIVGKISSLNRLGRAMSQTLAVPTLLIGRLGGQFAKPRSETIERETRLPVYRGDLINDQSENICARQARVGRLLEGYFHAAATANFVRTTCPSTPGAADSYGPYLSHEGLVLPYEEALTRFRTERQSFYNLGSHSLWIGERTRALHEAHVEYFRGIANPIAVKIGSSISPTELIQLSGTLDPLKQPGRLTLITRFGHDQVDKALPPLVRALQMARHPVLWVCDPMHGNTRRRANGRKVRLMDDISKELERTILIHNKLGSQLGGLHLELSGEQIQECLDHDTQGDGNSETQYRSACDPRLNMPQSLKLVELASKKLKASSYVPLRQPTSAIAQLYRP